MAEHDVILIPGDGIGLGISAVTMPSCLGKASGDTRAVEAAERIKGADNRALQNGQKAADLGGTLTSGFATAVIQRLD